MTHLCLTLALCAAPVPAGSKGTPATIFVARKIVTMERRQATATAVAVVGDRIVAVGTLDEVQAATRRTAPKKVADVMLRYNFPAAGLTEDALRTLILLVLTTGADVRRSLTQ